MVKDGYSKLDLGSGSKPYSDYVGIDIGCESERVIKSDVLDYLKVLADQSVSHIYSRHYLEHVSSEYLIKLLHEVDRILIPGGVIQFTVPHYSNPYFYSDPTHKTPFGVHTFSYFCQKSCLKRRVPRYVSLSGWSLINVEVNFVSMFSPRLLGIKLPTIATLLNKLINQNFFFIEFFERYFCSLFSIYQIKYLIEKDTTS